MKELKEYITIKEATANYNVAYSTLRERCTRGTIECERIGNLWLLKISSVDKNYTKKA